MTHKAAAPRTLRLEGLTRIEGEATLHIEIDEAGFRDAQLHVYEPPRFFEALLRGRKHTEPPDITARICGICPVAHQLTACAAIEDACGVAVDERIAALRRLLYCGEWIESHALHIHLLHAPDFLGYESAIALAGDHRLEVTRGLALKKLGNELMEVVGGRAVHPVNVRVGGFYRVPRRSELDHLVPTLEAAIDDAVAVVDWVSSFDFPDLDGDWELVALREQGRYPITGGRLASTGGLDLGARELGSFLHEDHIAWSTALRGELSGRGVHLLGPLARFVLNVESLSPLAREAARRAGIDAATRNPYRSIVVRAVELLHACEEALDIVRAYEPPDRPWVEVEPRAGEGAGWTEAPRGLLWHRYVLDDDGTIVDAQIVPPTAQNERAIERDVADFVRDRVDLPDHDLGHLAERVIRNHDPCISCATHFLDVHVDRP